MANFNKSSIKIPSNSILDNWSVDKWHWFVVWILCRLHQTFIEQSQASSPQPWWQKMNSPFIGWDCGRKKLQTKWCATFCKQELGNSRTDVTKFFLSSNWIHEGWKHKRNDFRLLWNIEQSVQNAKLKSFEKWIKWLWNIEHQ